MSDTTDSKNILHNFLKSNKEDHYNFEEEIDYKVSSGSLQFDLQLGGGFGPGLHRFCGMNEGGKTSEALEVMRNFLTTVPNSKAVYFKAEGRLSKEIRERSGIEFTFGDGDWNTGSCFVFESNIYETVINLMRLLVGNNEHGVKYCFVLDSVDGLILKNDCGKEFSEGTKVAGGAKLAGEFMQRMSIALAKRGHMAIFISQVRANIQIDPYSKAPIRQTSATGGNALLHFANWIIEFEPRFAKDVILQNPSIKKMDAKNNPAIGHFAKAIIRKSPNEKTNNAIIYPIRYGRKKGSSIWIEKEIVDLLYAWEFISKKGYWIKITDEFADIIKENKLNFPEKIQGDNNVFKAIEQDSDLSAFLVNYFKNAIGELT